MMRDVIIFEKEVGRVSSVQYGEVVIGARLVGQILPTGCTPVAIVKSGVTTVLGDTIISRDKLEAVAKWLSRGGVRPTDSRFMAPSDGG